MAHLSLITARMSGASFYRAGSRPRGSLSKDPALTGLIFSTQYSTIQQQLVTVVQEAMHGAAHMARANVAAAALLLYTVQYQGKKYCLYCTSTVQCTVLGGLAAETCEIIGYFEMTLTHICTFGTTFKCSNSLVGLNCQFRNSINY